jgi:hypothetical protein
MKRASWLSPSLILGAPRSFRLAIRKYHVGVRLRLSSLAWL